MAAEGHGSIDALSQFWLCFTYFHAGQASSVNNNLWLHRFKCADEVINGLKVDIHGLYARKRNLSLVQTEGNLIAAPECQSPVDCKKARTASD